MSVCVCVCVCGICIWPKQFEDVFQALASENLLFLLSGGGSLPVLESAEGIAHDDFDLGMKAPGQTCAL